MLRYNIASALLCLFVSVLPAADLPAPWASADIGTVGVTGSASEDAGVYTLGGSGADIWNSSDAFRFVYQPLSGDGDVITRVTSVGSTNAWAKAGVMIRESLNPGSAHAFVALTPGNGVAFQRRPVAGGSSANTAGGAASAPVWLRLSRRGGSLQAFRSADGVTWDFIGAATVNMAMDVYAGLALTSHNNSVLNTSTFEAPSVSACGCILPSPWQHGDVGAVGIAGSAHHSGSTFTIKASGADIWNTADGFHFIHQQVSGDGEIVARVTGLQANNVWAKAGVMIRESLEPGARHAMLALTPGNGLAFQRRTATDATSTHYAAGAGAAPVWVRLVRTGNTVFAFRSNDGVQWQFVSSASIALPPNAYFGLALTAHANAYLATATYDGVNVTLPGPLGMLPPPWQQHDVGAVGVGGYSSYSSASGEFTLSGSGADVWGTADGFQFVHQTLDGDGELTARINAIQNTNAWAKAGIMLRESLQPGSRHIMLAATPGNGLALQRRTVENGASAHTALGSTTLPIWFKFVRTGNTIQALTSPDGVDWHVAGTLTLAFNAQIQAGLFVTSHNNGVLNTSLLDHVSLLSQNNADTTPPVVTPPANQTVEAASASGTLVHYPPASATDNVTPSPVITHIPPSGSVLPLGETTVVVRATDAAGNVGTASFTVTVRDTTAPLLSAQNVDAEATSAAGASVTFSAMATDAVTSPLTVVFNPSSGSLFPLGATPVTATAADAAGNVGSATFTVTVRDTTAPQIVVQNMAVEATGPAGAAVTFAANVSDAVSPAPTVVYAPPSGSVFPLGVSTVNVTATDTAGNVGTAGFTVTVRDTTPPQITVANIVTEATSAAGAAVPLSATATDAVTLAPVLSFTPPSNSVFALGVTPVNVSATDTAGNVSSANFTVTVTDTTPPQIVAQNIVAEATSATGAAVSFSAMASDAVTPAPVLTYNPPSGSQFPLGESTVAVSASDSAGNIGNAAFAVSVRDTTPPLVTVPADIFVATAGGAVVVVYPPATASDLVTAAPTLTYSKASGSSFELGETIVEVRATDAAGNIGLGTFRVVVQLGLPPLPPTLLQPSGIVTQSSPAYQWSAVGDATYYELAVQDVTAGAEVFRQNNIQNTTFTPSLTLQNNHAYSFTVRAGNSFGLGNAGPPGNFTAQLQNNDQLPPVITTGPALLLEAESSQGATVVTFPVTVVDDTSANPTVIFNPPAGTFPLGATSVTISASDDAGNIATATLMVIVQDTVPPVFVAPPAMTLEANARNGALFVPPVVTASDNATANPQVTFAPAAGTLLPLGVNSVAVSAIDGAFNAHTHAFEVTVVDTTPPVIDAPAEVTLEATGPAGALLVYPLEVTDICDPVPFTRVDLPPAGPNSVGLTLPYPSERLITVIARDASGNSSTRQILTRVVDTVPPTFTQTPPALIEVSTSTLPASVSLRQYYAAQDLVSPVTFTLQPALTQFGAGDTAVQIFARDAAGNEASVSTTVRVTYIPPEPPDPPAPPTEPEPRAIRIDSWSHSSNPWNRAASPTHTLTADVTLLMPTDKRLQNAFRRNITGVVSNNPAHHQFNRAEVRMRRIFTRNSNIGGPSFSNEYISTTVLPDQAKTGTVQIQSEWDGRFGGVDVPPGIIRETWSVTNVWWFDDFSLGNTDAMGNPVPNGSFARYVDEMHKNPQSEIDVQNWIVAMRIANLPELHQNGLPMARVKRPVIIVEITPAPEAAELLSFYDGAVAFNGSTLTVSYANDIIEGHNELRVKATMENGDVHIVFLTFEGETEGPYAQLEPYNSSIVGPSFPGSIYGARAIYDDNSQMTNVALSLNGSVISKALTDPQNYYFVELIARGFFVEGTNTLTATGSNIYGNSSTHSVTFTYDETPPVILNVSPADGTTVQSNQPMITMAYSDATSGIPGYNSQVVLDGERVYSVSPGPGGFSFTPDSPLADGEHTVEVTVADGVNNLTRHTWSFRVDTTPPQLILQVYSDPVMVFQPDTIIRGYVSADATVTFESGSLPSGLITHGSGAGLKPFTLRLQDIPAGYHTLTLTATDSLQRQYSKVLAIERGESDSDGDGIPDGVDDAPNIADNPPHVLMLRPQHGDRFQQNQSIHVSATISDDSPLSELVHVVLLVDGEEQSLTQTNGRVSTVLTLDVGEHILDMRVRDGRGRDVFAGSRLVRVESDVSDIRVTAVHTARFASTDFGTVRVSSGSGGDAGVVAMEPPPPSQDDWGPEYGPWTFQGVSSPATAGAGRWLLDKRPIELTTSGEFNFYIDWNEYSHQGYAVTRNGVALPYYVTHPGLEPVVMKSSRTTRVAIQKGDSFWVTGQHGKYVAGLDDQGFSVGNRMNVSAPGSSQTGAVEISHHDYYTGTYYGLPLTYANAGKSFGITVGMKDSNGNVLESSSGSVDVFDVRLDAQMNGQMLNDNDKHVGLSLSLDLGDDDNDGVDNLSDDSLLATNPRLAKLIVRQPTAGTVGNVSVPAEGTVSLHICAPGASHGLGHARLWQDSNNDGTLEPYDGAPFDAELIGVEGRIFYLQGISPSAVERDVSVLLEFDPAAPSGEEYNYKRICRDAVWVRRISGLALIADANHDGTLDSTDRYGSQIPHGVVAASGFELPSEPGISERVPLRVLGGRSVAPGEIVELSWKSTGVRVFDAPVGGTQHLGTSVIWGPGSEIPAYLFLEADHDFEDTFTLNRWSSPLAPWKFELLEASHLKIARLSNGLGADDGIAAHSQIVPGFASVGLVRGNLHISAVAKEYSGPAFGPDVVVSFNHLDGLETGVGKGWRTNYDVRLFDGAGDRNADGTIQFTERHVGELLVLIDELGRRHTFGFNPAASRFESRSLTGLVSGFVEVMGASNTPILGRDSKPYSYRLTRLDNQFLFFRADGRLARIEDIRGQALQVERSPDGPANFVTDSYGRMEPLRGSAFGGSLDGNLQSFTGGQLPPLTFQYSNGRIASITVTGLSVGTTPPGQTPTSATGSNVYSVSYNPESVRVERVDLTPQYFMTFDYADSASREPASTVSIRTWLGGTVDYDMDTLRDAWTLVRNPSLVVVNREIRPKDRRLMRETNGRRSESFDYFADGKLKSHTVSGGVSMDYTYESLGTPGVSLVSSVQHVGIGSNTIQYYDTGNLKGLVHSQTNAVNDTNQYFYDASGFPERSVDPRDMSWHHFGRTRYGQPQYMYSPEGRWSSARYDIDGQIQSQTDVMNYTTTYHYDTMRRLTTVNGPGGVTSLNRQDTFGRAWQQQTASGLLTTSLFDPIGRLLYANTNGLAPVTLSYNDFADFNTYESTATRAGRTLSIERVDFGGRTLSSAVPRELEAGAAPEMAETEYRYTVEGWPEKVIDPMENEWTSEYDTAGRKTAQVTPLGRRTTTHFKPGTDWVERIVDADTLTTRYERDAIGRAERVFNAKQGSVRWRYVKGLLQSIEPSLGRGESFTYDRDGLQQTHTDTLNKITVTTYEFAARKIRKVYDGKEHRTTVTTLDSRGYPEEIERLGFGQTLLEHRNDGVTTAVTPPARGKSGISLDTLDRVTARYQELSATETAESSTSYDPLTGFVTGSVNELDLTTTPTINPQTGEVQKVHDSLTAEPAQNSNFKVLKRDRRGLTLEYEDAEKRTWVMTYDADGRKATLTSPGTPAERIVTEWIYANGGASNRLQNLRRNGDTWTFDYDELNNVVLQIAPGTPQIRSSAVYDQLGKLTSETIGTLTTVHNYDPQTQLLFKTAMPSDDIYFDRDEYGRVQYVYDKRVENITATEYDDFDRPTFVLHPDQKFETFSYVDQNGAAQPDLQLHTDRFHRTTRFQRDLAGRVTNTIFENDEQGQPQQASYGYNKAGQVVSETFKNSTLSKSYDPRMRLSSVGAVSMQYYNDNRIKRKSWPGYALDYQYKPQSGYLDRVISPDGPAVYAHDNKGRVSQVSLPGGVEQTFKYDGADRRTSMTQRYGGRTERFAWRYDNASRIASVTEPAGTTVYTYQGQRLQSETRTGASRRKLAYGFDNSGNRTGVTEFLSQTHTLDFAGPDLPAQTQVLSGDWTAGGTLNSAAAGRMRLTLAPDDGQFYAVKVQMDDAGLQSGGQRAAGFSFAEQADGSRYVASLVLIGAPEGTQARLRLHYVTSAGTVETRGESDSFAFDGLSHTLVLNLADDGATLGLDENEIAEPLSIAYENGTGSLGLETTFAAAFDDLQWQSFTANAAQTVAYNAINQVDHPDFTYNAAGHLTRQMRGGVEWQFKYDRLDRLESATANGVTRTFSYAGASWMRTAISDGSSTESFIHDGFACVSHTAGGGTTNYFAPGGRALFESGPTGITSYLNDGMGNVGALGRNNALVERYDYTAFGEHSARDAAGSALARSSGPRYRGEWHDAPTNQHYLRNRQYDPQTGRFLTLDPKGMADGPNRYNYCGGDPVNRTDPMGTDYIEIGGLMGDASRSVNWVVTTGIGRQGDIIRKVPIGSMVRGKGYTYATDEGAYTYWNYNFAASGFGGRGAQFYRDEFDSFSNAVESGSLPNIEDAKSGIWDLSRRVIEESVSNMVSSGRANAGYAGALQDVKNEYSKPALGRIIDMEGSEKYLYALLYNIETGFTIGGFANQDGVQGALDAGDPRLTLSGAKSQTRWNVAKAGIGTALTVMPLKGRYHGAGESVLNANVRSPIYLDLNAPSLLTRGAGLRGSSGLDLIAEIGSRLRIRNFVELKPKIHHIATPYGDIGKQFKDLFDLAGLDLDSAFNKVKIEGHVGPHGWYNQYTFGRLSASVEGLQGPAYRKALIDELLELRWELKNTDLGDLLRASGR